MTNNGEGLARLEAKVDVLVRLISLALIRDLSSLKERAVMLNRAGLPPKEIAALCDTTPNTISVALSAAKKEAKR
jgi:DNA-directed RNA polymerase specialized sigma24 family protein